MSYLGKQPAVGTFGKLDSIAGLQNGSTTSFQLKFSNQPFTPDNAEQLLVVHNGEVLEPGQDYSVNGTYITILPAPDSNDAIFIISLGHTHYTGVPSDGTVSSAKIADASIGYDKLSGDAIATMIGNIITFGI